MNCIVSGGEAAGPLKLRKGFLGRRSIERRNTIVDRQQMQRRPSQPILTTLDDLEAALGRYGKAARLEACFTAMKQWARATNAEGCRHSLRLVLECIRLSQERSFYHTGLRLPNGREPLRVFDRLDADLQAEARSILADTVEDWERAGMPGIRYTLLRATHGSFRAAIIITKKIKRAAQMENAA